MDRTLIYKIEKEQLNTLCGANEHAVTIYNFLSNEGYSAQLFKRFRHGFGSVKVNDKEVLLRSTLNDGDILEIFIPEETSSENIIPVHLPFPVIYEDDDIVVINKPADMPIHPSQNNYDNTLGNSAAYYYANESTPFVYRCINRLDRDTTGLTVIAKNILSASILSKAMQEREIHRTYFGIVKDTANELVDNGTINKPIARVYTSTIERCVDYENGEEAITHYSVIKRENGFALLKFILETGRTHQIRVHMQSTGHPLLGDFLYNPEDKTMPRQALHGGILEFTHPVTKKALSFEAPFPKDFIITSHNLRL